MWPILSLGFERGELPLRGRLADSERLRGCEAAFALDRKHLAKVVPVERGSTDLSSGRTNMWLPHAYAQVLRILPSQRD